FYWKEPHKRDYKITQKPETLPFSIEEISEDILKEVIGCLNNGKEETMCTTAFRIMPAELSFYKKIGISLPKFCPNCRHFARLAKRNPLRLWKRSCTCTQANHGHKGDCKNEFQTTYAPER